ncbi:MAG TPA: hypothetical protein VEB20_00830 [Azospirillaceae bacterium]|nr:hypothetical protein [Azospirillaceae bacterium]
MHLVQILLPLYDNDGRPQPRDAFARVRTELAERYDGLTAYTRAPAEGLWRSEGETARDDVVLFEVMVPELDAAWWRAYGRDLAARFRQEVVLIRAHPVQVL